MSCKDVEMLLDDYVDGDLGAREQGEVESHLARCADCRRALDELRGLQEAVGALPRDLTPGRDLLPAIREVALRHGRGETYFRPGLRLVAAAAAVVILAAAAWLGWRGRAGGGPDPAGFARPERARLAGELTLSEFEAAELEYERATKRLLEILEARQDGLSPGTRDIVTENLKIIDGAIAEARAALEADPTDARNGHALNALHRRKVELLWRLSRVSS
jgi:anti-sigma factor RsiW